MIWHQCNAVTNRNTRNLACLYAPSPLSTAYTWVKFCNFCFFTWLEILNSIHFVEHKRGSDWLLNNVWFLAKDLVCVSPSQRHASNSLIRSGPHLAAIGRGTFNYLHIGSATDKWLEMWSVSPFRVSVIGLLPAVLYGTRGESGP